MKRGHSDSWVKSLPPWANPERPPGCLVRLPHPILPPPRPELSDVKGLTKGSAPVSAEARCLSLRHPAADHRPDRQACVDHASRQGAYARFAAGNIDNVPHSSRLALRMEHSVIGRVDGGFEVLYAVGMECFNDRDSLVPLPQCGQKRGGSLKD